MSLLSSDLINGPFRDALRTCQHAKSPSGGYTGSSFAHLCGFRLAHQASKMRLLLLRCKLLEMNAKMYFDMYRFSIKLCGDFFRQ